MRIVPLEHIERGQTGAYIVSRVTLCDVDCGSIVGAVLCVALTKKYGDKDGSEQSKTAVTAL